jgi:TRAP-type uncharacterized transport system substrate-binding protein
VNILSDLLKSSRRRLIFLVVTVAAFIALATWLAVARLRPMLQRTVAMATYPEGSLNAELVKRYRDILARDGIDLKPEPSAGAIEAIARLKDSKSETSIAFIPGGLITEQDSPQLVSLGTLFYQPLWIFSRYRPVQRHGQPRHFRISIGPEGSSSWISTYELRSTVNDSHRVRSSYIRVSGWSERPESSEVY